MWASREILCQMLQQRLHILLLFHQCQFHIAILNMLLVLILNRYAKKNGIMKHNKLHHFQPLIGITPLSGVYCRQDETVLRRCRIGHTLYTLSYILKSEDRPRCVGCDEDITVKHILLDFVDFTDQRPRFYSSPNLKHLFIQVPGHQIVSFLKAIVLYGKF